MCKRETRDLKKLEEISKVRIIGLPMNGKVKRNLLMELLRKDDC